MEKKKTLIKICLGSSCFTRGNSQTLEVIKKYLADHHLKDKVDFRGELCSGNCKHGPVLKIDGKIFYEVDQNTVVRILEDHLKQKVTQ